MGKSDYSLGDWRKKEEGVKHTIYQSGPCYKEASWKGSDQKHAASVLMDGGVKGARSEKPPKVGNVDLGRPKMRCSQKKKRQEPGPSRNGSNARECASGGRKGVVEGCGIKRTMAGLRVKSEAHRDRLGAMHLKTTKKKREGEMAFRQIGGGDQT